MEKNTSKKVKKNQHVKNPENEKFIRKEPGLRELLILICVIFPLWGSAKDHVNVTGTVLESVAMHQPVPYASIKILNAADSSSVTVVSADEYSFSGEVTAYVEESRRNYTGGFHVELPRGKKYIFSVSSMGYAPTCVDVDLSTFAKREYILKLLKTASYLSYTCYERLERGGSEGIAG